MSVYNGNFNVQEFTNTVNITNDQTILTSNGQGFGPLSVSKTIGPVYNYASQTLKVDKIDANEYINLPGEGGGGGSSSKISIVSNAPSVNSWVINTTSLTKKYYQFYLYSSDGFASFTTNSYVDNTSITTPATVGLVLTGLLAKVDNVFQTGNRITYCNGYQEYYNWSKDTYGYLASNINNFTTAVDIVSIINGVGEIETCPPTPGEWNGCQLEISIKDGYVNLPSASTLTLVCFPLD